MLGLRGSGQARTLAWCSRAAALCALISLSAPTVVRAEGSTVNPGGTKALARGGAVVARPEDPLALLHNPAGLASVEGVQLYVGLDIPFYRACSEPIGYYGWGVYEPGVSEFGDSGQVARDPQGRPLPDQYATRPLDDMCNTAADIPVPQLAVSWRVNESLGLGFGFVGPTLIPNQQWGGEDGTIERDGRTWPTPTRYQMIEQKVTFAFAPTLGAGLKVLPWLAVGLGVQWVALGVESTVIQTQNAGTSPHNDMLVRVRASDYFIPSGVLSVHAAPHETLDFALTFSMRDAFDGSGEAVFETNTYQEGDQAAGIPYVNAPIELENLHVPLPWALTAGARYSQPLGALPEGAPEPAPGMPRNDPMATELFDVELDLALVLNERASETSVKIRDTCEHDADGQRIPTGAGSHSQGCQTLTFQRTDASGALVEDIIDVPAQGLESYTVDRHWENQIIVRLGGSFSVLPRRLQLHAGAYYETRGVDPDYANIDSMLFRRIGVGLGAALRIGRFDLMLGFGHIFQETLEVAAPPHQPRDLASGDPQSGFDKRIGQPCPIGQPDCPFDQPVEESNPPSDPDGTAGLQQGSIINSPNAQARAVNAGIYRANIDVVSLGVVYHF